MMKEKIQKILVWGCLVIWFIMVFIGHHLFGENISKCLPPPFHAIDILFLINFLIGLVFILILLILGIYKNKIVEQS